MYGRRSEYDMKATGKKLKYYRKKMHLSVEQVRQYMCLSSVQAIYKWERGDSFPAVDNFMALTELYRVSPLDLLVKKNFAAINNREENDFFRIECHKTSKLYQVYFS